MEAELKASRDPLVRISVSICIASEDENDLAENVRVIREWYEDHNFVIEKPMTDQFKLFMEFIPGSGRFLNDYILPIAAKNGSRFYVCRNQDDR